jgi:hypothetical protein
MMFAFDRLSGMPTLDALPIRMEQTNSRSSTVFRLVLLSPALVLLAVPMLVGAHVAGGPSTRAIAAEQPFAVAQVLLGFVLWAGLLAIPVTQALARLGATRRIAIDRQSVTVEETRFGSRQVWRVPLSEYRGIAHHVRTSVSGARHELVLVHADPRRHVLLVTGDRIAQSTLDKAKVLLGLPELPARAI